MSWLFDFIKILQSLYLSRMNSQRGCWVVWKSSNSGLIQNIFTKVSLSAFARCNWCVPSILLSIRYDTRYHICVFARCNWCVPIILLSIRYNVCTCRPIYCCLSGTTCIPVIVPYIITSLLLLSTVYCIIAVCVVVM